MSTLGSETLHTQGRAHMLAGDFLVPFMTAVERGASASYLDLETAFACLAISMIVSGTPAEPWAAWVFASVIGGRDAFLRIHPRFLKRYLAEDQYRELLAWVDLQESGKALSKPRNEIQDENPDVVDFLLDIDTAVRFFC
jgi:hypothetical protein